MSRVHFYILILCLASALSACGGGGGSNSNDAGNNTVSADLAYTGSRDPALLNKNNTLPFVQVLLGSNELLGDETAFRHTQSETAQVRGIISTHNSLQQAVQQEYRRHTYLQRETSFNDTNNCEFGGKVSVSGVADDSNGTGTATYQFTNCRTEQSLMLNGALIMEIRAFNFNANEPTSYVMTFNRLTIKDGNETAVFIGTTDYEINSASSLITEKLNLHAKDGASGEERMMKDLTLISGRTGVTSKVAGKLFISDFGYVDASSSSDLRLGEVIEDGEILLQGAAQSAARVTVHGQDNNGQYRVDLDADGDGTYELKSVQSTHANDSNGFSVNRVPVVDINYDEPWSEDGFRIGDSVQLLAYGSYDPDGDVFTYTWSIEEKPEGSSLSFDGPDITDTQIQYAYTTELDKLGNYKFSLKLTDVHGASAVGFVDITLSDSPPKINEIYVNGFTATDNDQQLEVGQSITAEAYIEDDYDHDVTGFSYLWELTKPVDSATILASDTESNTTFTPDVVGSYKIKLVITDSSGGVDAFTRTFEVVHTPPTAEIWLFEGNLIQLGAEIQLGGYSSYSPTDYYLDYLWTVESAPAGSSVSTFSPNSQEGQVSFTPDKVGIYRIGLTVTDDYGAEGSTYKNISVVAAE